MLTQSDLLDMYSLASPRECRQYTVFTSKTIDSFFKKLDLYPRQGEDGRFYFQKLQTIQRLPGDFAARQQTTCFEISRFFIRILHIFASLSLTVIDIEIPSSTESLNYTYSGNKNKNGKRFVRENEVLSLPFMRDRMPQRGGVLQQSMVKYYIKSPAYKVLNDYLEYFSGSSTYALTGTDIRIPIASVNPDTPEPTLLYTGKDKNKKPVSIVAKLIMDIDANKLRVRLKIIKPEVRSPDPVDFRTDDPYLPPKYNNQTLPKWIMNEFNKILGGDEYDLNTNGRNITRRRTRASIPEDIAPGFRVKGILDALAQPIPVKAYCVARAIQLLSPQTIYNSRKGVTARTHICDPDFSLLGKGSLPKSGTSITTSSSIMSLNLLFYDALDNSAPIISKSTLPKYETFVKTMRAVYQEEAEAKNTNIDMNKITNAMNPTLCKARGKLYLKDEAAVAELRASVERLLAAQLEHTGKVMAILKKLFIITPSKPFLLQPAIETGGIEAVEQVAAEARELLIDYYSKCEVTYREAVQDLKERLDTDPNLFKTS
jgi:hypothetical protein